MARPFLDRDYPPCGEAVPVSNAVHRIDDGPGGVSRSHEMGVQAMCLSFFGNGSGRGGKCLPQHLAAEYAGETQILAPAPVNVFLNLHIPPLHGIG